MVLCEPVIGLFFESVVDGTVAMLPALPATRKAMTAAMGQEMASSGVQQQRLCQLDAAASSCTAGRHLLPSHVM